ncbi:hypothetical protein [Aromatoleum petrolei]|uniref:Uncharacterized protein n=1 Tax=Aromatoleum petrolei TaxID=76116 RepID=A0ABX1MMY2_9RHOO|nr:hypothetical protein [Aromatoleum petrolei]NMF87716.1 hypothetical protein [Aromatoleum petrolei]QTQ38204.1 Uncharacterized protein ToN1_41000 [Aromatoleum petrolei]
MIRNPIDASVRVSTRLAELIESRCNDPDVDQPITLGQLRTLVADVLPPSVKAAERMHHFDVEESDLDELDALIEEYGEDSVAVDFLQVSASEPLSRVIETLVNEADEESLPTLGQVREAMAAGLLTRLVGDGVLEDDEDDGLLAEMEGLIERFGPDALAENFLRLE